MYVSTRRVIILLINILSASRNCMCSSYGHSNFCVKKQELDIKGEVINLLQAGKKDLRPIIKRLKTLKLHAFTCLEQCNKQTSDLSF